jgi:1-acyl-sn-glycerol-3-phosphate acyltransferase
MRSVRAFIVLAAFFAFTLPLMPLQLLFLWTGSRYARSFPHWYHRQVCRIIGIRLNIDGNIARDHGVLLISNHVSWVDIPVLSAVAPVSFVAKQEVSTWPFVSWLAKLQRSVFVDRNRKSEVTGKANEILERLKAGDHVVLFAEGTSSDGNSVVSFKTPLFAAAKPSGGQPLGANICAQTLFAVADARSSPGMAIWIWPATPGGFWVSARSTLKSALARQSRSTNSPIARRLPAMPKPRCEMTSPNCSEAVRHAKSTSVMTSR